LPDIQGYIHDRIIPATACEIYDQIFDGGIF